MNNETDVSSQKESYAENKGGSELDGLFEDNLQTLMTDGGEFTGPSATHGKYERFRNKYERLMEKHIETQDELNAEIRSEHEGLIQEYGDVIDLLEEKKEEYEEFEQEHRQMLSEYQNVTDKFANTLDDFSDRERNYGVRNGLQSALFFGIGLLSASAYSGEGALDFYANAGNYYSTEPGAALLTLGLPLLGAWYLKNTVDSFSESRRLDNEADKWREHRADITEGLHQEDETPTVDRID